MKGDNRILEMLQNSIEAELRAINQDVLYVGMLEHWGLGKLSLQIKKLAIEEMIHMQRFMERMFLLEGQPKIGLMIQVQYADDVLGFLQNSLVSEMSAARLYHEGALLAEEIGDAGSHALFDSILRDEERHINYLETRIRLVRSRGATSLEAED